MSTSSAFESLLSLQHLLSRPFFFAGAVALCLSCGPLATLGAAQTSGTIRGSVESADGAPLAGAELHLESLETGQRRNGRSDAEGRFTFPSLPVGTYRMRAEADGFRTLVRDDVVLTVNETITLALVLEPGAG